MVAVYFAIDIHHDHLHLCGGNAIPRKNAGSSTLWFLYLSTLLEKYLQSGLSHLPKNTDRAWRVHDWKVCIKRKLHPPHHEAAKDMAMRNLCSTSTLCAFADECPSLTSTTSTGFSPFMHEPWISWIFEINRSSLSVTC
jgi:hypothetical protein